MDFYFSKYFRYITFYFQQGFVEYYNQAQNHNDNQWNLGEFVRYGAIGVVGALALGALLQRVWKSSILLLLYLLFVKCHEWGDMLTSIESSQDGGKVAKPVSRAGFTLCFFVSRWIFDVHVFARVHVWNGKLSKTDWIVGNYSVWRCVQFWKELQQGFNFTLNVCVAAL